MVDFMEKVFFNGKMEINMMDIIHMEKKKVMENILLKMEMFIKVNGLEINLMEEEILKLKIIFIILV